MTETIGQDATPTSEYLRIVWRRKWIIALIATLLIALAVAAAILLPAKYQSTATILIEEPGVADDSGRDDASFANQRLQRIQQRVMTTSKLVGVIEKLNLYADARATTPINVIANNMRNQIDLQLVDSAAAERNSRNAPASTAFTISFTARSAETAQRVTQELVELYISENERSQRDRVVGTAGFYSTESNRLAAQIKDLEGQLAVFKSQNSGMLPEDLAFNMQTLERNQNQLLELMRQAQALRERQAFLQAQLATIEPLAPVNSNAPETLSPRAALRLLKSQYAAMNAKYGPRHPDVLNLKRQIEGLGGTVDGGRSVADIAQLESRLATAKEKYGASHPEVVGLERELKAARNAVSTAPADPGAGAPDNPVYVQTAGQLNALGAESSMIQGQMAGLQDKIAAVEERIRKSPEVERAYSALRRDYDAAVAQLQDLQQRGSQAELQKNMESEQMGERLSLVEPPQVPLEPISPNRPAIVLLGIVLGLSAGVAMAFLVESLDGRVYGQRRLAAITGDSPLVFVPRIRAGHDRRHRGQRAAAAAVSLLLIATALIIGMNSSPESVSSLWATLMDQARGS